MTLSAKRIICNREEKRKAPHKANNPVVLTKKVKATIFRDCRGILLIDFKGKNINVNAEYYSALLHRLRGSIKEK